MGDQSVNNVSRFKKPNSLDNETRFRRATSFVDSMFSEETVNIRDALRERLDTETACPDFPGDAVGLYGPQLSQMVEKEEAILKRTRNRRRSPRTVGSKRGYGVTTLLPEIELWLESTSRAENSFLMDKVIKAAKRSSLQEVFATGDYLEDFKHEDDEVPMLFTLDFGEQDAAVKNLIEIMDTELYPAEQIMSDSERHRSLYTVSNANLEKLGLKLILIRTAVVLEFAMELSCEAIYIDKEMDISAYINIMDIFAKIVRRTDIIFAKELGHISGSLVLFHKHILIMLEGPEISIMDVFTQLKSLPFMRSITKGIVLFIMTHVLMRYLPEWSDMFGEDDVNLAKYYPGVQLSVEDPTRLKTYMKILGQKCRRLWKSMRQKNLSGRGHSWTELDIQVIPEPALLDLAISSGLFRDFHTWIDEITNFGYTGMEAIDVKWPDNGWSLPEMKTEEDPVRNQTDEVLPMSYDLMAFLNGSKVKRKRFFIEDNEIISEHEDATMRLSNVMLLDGLDELVDQPSLSRLMNAGLSGISTKKEI